MNHPDSLAFAGIEIVVSEHAYKTEDVARTWRERLFSRPWRPRRKWRTVRIPQFYKMHMCPGAVPTIVMHPDLYAQLPEEYKR